MFMIIYCLIIVHVFTIISHMNKNNYQIIFKIRYMYFDCIFYSIFVAYYSFKENFLIRYKVLE